MNAVIDSNATATVVGLDLAGKSYLCYFAILLTVFLLFWSKYVHLRLYYLLLRFYLLTLRT